MTIRARIAALHRALASRGDTLQLIDGRQVRVGRYPSAEAVVALVDALKGEPIPDVWADVAPGAPPIIDLVRRMALQEREDGHQIAPAAPNRTGEG